MRKYIFAAIPLVLLVSCAIQLACSSGGGLTTPPVTNDAAYPPRNLHGSGGNERIFLDWDSVPFAIGYRVYISTNAVDFSRHSGDTIIPTNSVVIADVANSVPYFLGVSAIGSTGTETVISYLGGAPDAKPITPTSVTTPIEQDVPPAPPKNLQGFAGDGLIHLDWDENTESDFQDYFVARRLETVNFFSIYVNPRVENSFDDDDVVNNNTYFYYVLARDQELLLSDPSNIVHYTPMSAPPLAPKDFTAIYAFSEGGVILNWDDKAVEPDVVQVRVIRYDITDEVDPMEDTSIVTLDFPHTVDPYDPPNVIRIPPFTDRFVAHEHIYKYELAYIDSEGQIGPPALSGDIEIPA